MYRINYELEPHASKTKFAMLVIALVLAAIVINLMFFVGTGWLLVMILNTTNLFPHTHFELWQGMLIVLLIYLCGSIFRNGVKGE